MIQNSSNVLHGMPRGKQVPRQTTAEGYLGDPTRTSDARGEDHENRGVTLSGGTKLQNGENVENSVLADSVSSPGHLDPRRTYVWYASYASNLWKARFMCYIEGGQVEGMGKVCLGSRNKTPPVASRWTMVPYNLFFGHSFTRTWGSGGVAFLDPVSHGDAPNTHVRLYKITLQQVCDLLIQENGGDPESSQVSIEWNHVDTLRDVQSASTHATLDFLKEGAWYGTIKYLGEEDGLPMLTVTCSVDYMQRFRERQIKVCPPSDRYSKVLLRGLLEHGTLSEEECKAYIASKSKGLPEDSNGEKIGIPDHMVA